MITVIPLVVLVWVLAVSDRHMLLGQEAVHNTMPPWLFCAILNTVTTLGVRFEQALIKTDWIYLPSLAFPKQSPPYHWVSILYVRPGPHCAMGPHLAFSKLGDWTPPLRSPQCFQGRLEIFQGLRQGGHLVGCQRDFQRGKCPYFVWGLGLPAAWSPQKWGVDVTLNLIRTGCAERYISTTHDISCLQCSCLVIPVHWKQWSPHILSAALENLAWNHWKSNQFSAHGIQCLCTKMQVYTGTRPQTGMQDRYIPPPFHGLDCMQPLGGARPSATTLVKSALNWSWTNYHTL